MFSTSSRNEEVLGILLGLDMAKTTPESPQQYSKMQTYDSFALKSPLWSLSGLELDKGSAMHVSWSYLIEILMYFKTETQITHQDANM